MADANVHHCCGEDGRGDIYVDASRWPIVVISLNGTPGIDTCERYFSCLLELMQRDEQMVAISVTDALKVTKSWQLRKSTEHFTASNKEFLRQKCKANISVVGHPVVRTVTRLYLTAFPIAVRSEVCANLQDALSLAEDILAGRR